MDFAFANLAEILRVPIERVKESASGVFGDLENPTVEAHDIMAIAVACLLMEQL